MTTKANKPDKGQEKAKGSRIKSVLRTMLETSKLLQGSTVGRVAGIATKVSVVLGAVYAIVELFF